MNCYNGHDIFTVRCPAVAYVGIFGAQSRTGRRVLVMHRPSLKLHQQINIFEYFVTLDYVESSLRVCLLSITPTWQYWWLVWNTWIFFAWLSQLVSHQGSFAQVSVFSAVQKKNNLMGFVICDEPHAVELLVQALSQYLMYCNLFTMWLLHYTCMKSVNLRTIYAVCSNSTELNV